VQVLRQHYDRINREPIRSACLANRRAQRLNVIEQGSRRSVRERDGEEERPACCEIPTISDHVEMLTRISLRSIRATALS